MSVIETVNDYHMTSCANAGRSAYKNSIQITAKIDFAREEIGRFFGAKKHEVAFAPGATHALNWVARGLNFAPGDKVLLTFADHHANILPWLELKKRGVQIVFAKCDVMGRIDIGDFAKNCKGAKLAAFIAASNVTGAISPLYELVQTCKENGALSVIDCAQLAPHSRVNFDGLGADFMAIAGHKMMSPKGAGVLLASEASQKLLKPLIVGGGSIKNVTIDGYELLPYPEGFESGTPSIEGILGLHAAIFWLQERGADNIYMHEQALCAAAREQISAISGIRVFQPDKATPTMAMVFDGCEPHKLAVQLDAQFNIAVRSGHMCALPLVRDIMGFEKGVLRVSFGPWNVEDDVTAIVSALKKLAV